MSLVTISDQLKRAYREHYAIPLFDAFDMLSAEGAFQAVEARRAPVIIALYSGIMDQPYIHALAAYVRTRAQEISTPVSLMLDHGASFEQCIQAITYGFTDVMYDGSRLPLEENIAQTRGIVRAAHAAGVHVEAELGHVGMGSDYDTFAAQRKGFTDPDMVERFVAETGVDFLAVAIGNAHGLYKGEPKLDLELLEEIHSRVNIPLVLHGGTGIPEEQFRAAIARGIAKINIATDLFITTTRRLAAACAKEDANYFGLLKIAIDSFQERCCYYLDLFGASGKS